MKKDCIFLFFLSFFLVFTSCSQQEIEETRVLDASIVEEEIVMDKILITANQTSSALKNGIFLDQYTMTFYPSEEVAGLSVNITETSEGYAVDVDKDFLVDFYIESIQVMQNQKFLVTYKDRQLKNLQKCLINIKDDVAELKVLDLYSPFSMNSKKSGSESWSNCFRRRMGSVTGIVLTVSAGFLGPWGGVSVATAAALSCVLYTLPENEYQQDVNTIFRPEVDFIASDSLIFNPDLLL